MGNKESIPQGHRENDLIEGNLRDGTGFARKIFASTDPHRRKLYEGTFLNGKRHGQGRLVWECGAVYEGRWIQDRLEGYGILTWPSGMKYCGEWKNNKFCGRGTFTWKNGRVYAGGWLDNKHHGMGILNYTEGDPRGRLSYEGNWSRGRRDGKGKMSWRNNACYVGTWLEGKREGFGMHQFPCGDVYEGMWHNGRRNGKGIRFFAGGEIYSGTWLDDKKHGRGVFKNAYGREELKSYDRGSLVNASTSRRTPQSLQVLCIERIAQHAASIARAEKLCLPSHLRESVVKCIKVQTKRDDGSLGGDVDSDDGFSISNILEDGLSAVWTSFSHIYP